MAFRRIAFTLLALAAVTACGTVASSADAAKPTTLTFHYIGVFGSDGVPQVWVVPKNVYSATFHVFGAQGASAPHGPAGGLGGEVSETVIVKPGEAVAIFVGGMPRKPYLASGGFNGGGSGGRAFYGADRGGGGGGASDVRKTPYGLADRLLVGGGGGGGAGARREEGYGGGGAGGGAAGKDGREANCNGWGPSGEGGGGAGTQTGGGAGGKCWGRVPPSQGGPAGGVGGQGGAGAVEHFPGAGTHENVEGAASGGGGGGGFYGGGGGEAGGFYEYESGVVIPPGRDEFPPREIEYFAGGGGGGGSSYGPIHPTYQTGVRKGDGLVTVTYTQNCSRGAPCVRKPPSAPTTVTAFAERGSALVGFAPPSTGAPIVSYTVTASPGGVHASGFESPITVKGLKNGKYYTFTVKATNDRGSSPASRPSGKVRPAPLPGPPSAVVATPGDHQATVTFKAAKSRWSPIAFYVVTAFGPGGRKAGGAEGPRSPITVSHLKDGVEYEFTVAAVNGIGEGPRSELTFPAVVPVGPPGAPTSVSAQPGNGSATVTFAAPRANGKPIQSYTITASPGGAMVTTKSTTATVSGLTDGTTYTFTVTATNVLGTGAPSKPSNAVTPAGPPAAPTAVVAKAGKKGAMVTFTAPEANGAPITSYAVTALSSDGGVELSVVGSTSPIGVGGLTSGKKYTFTVIATNSAGTGPPSAPSNEVTIE
jgi:fibronectin type III domain protein